jgi:outer membrane lipoprotein-sorting protein
MFFLKQFIFLCLLIVTCNAIKPAPTSVPEITYQKVTPDALAKIAQYWNSIRIIVADIKQTNPDGTHINGKLYLKKGKGNSAKLRVDYQADYKQQLLIKKSEVLLIDLTDGAVAAYPVSMTPAGLILKPHLNFEKDVKLVDSRQVGDDVQLVLAHSDDENGGTLTLNFIIENNCRLLRWKVLDPQGNMTEVELSPETIRLNDEKLVPDSLF